MVLAQTVQNTVPINIRINNGPLVTLGVTKSISLSAQVSAQFANAFDQSIYVVPFGDQPGDIAITFIVNPKAVCNGELVGPDQQALQFYINRRVMPGLSRQNRMTITVGSVGFVGYLVGVRYDGQAADQPIQQATLLFKAWP
jgi:hypothetical protein